MLTPSAMRNRILPTVWLLLLAANSFGAEIKPKAGASLKNTYVWDGETLKPRAGALLDREQLNR